MGLRETIASQVTGAFATVGNLKQAMTLYQQTAGSYNPATGAVTRTTTGHPVNAVLISPKRHDLEDPMVRATDAIALIDPAEIPSVVPQTGQRISDAAGTDYDIIKAGGIAPADGGPALLWKLVLRRPSAEAA